MKGGTVSLADILGDQQFFVDRPHRRYRLRRGWAVRRRGRGVFLRTALPEQHRYDTQDASEAEAERAWWECAWPMLPPGARAALAKAARGQKAGRSVAALPNSEGSKP